MLNLIKRIAGASQEAPAPQPLMLGGVTIPLEQEPLGWLLCGSTGSGKSTGLAEMLDCITARGDRALIVDPNGTFLSHFHHAGDVVLNVFDQRSPGWSPFNEVRRDYDFDKIARSLVPDGLGADAAWHFYGQCLIAAVMRALIKQGRGNTAALLEALTVWPADKLHGLVAGSAIAGLFDKDAARALASTRFVLSSHLKPYDSLKPGSFSVREWVERADANASQNLFITWREDMTASLAPLIAAWVDVACTATLSLAPNPRRRLWFIVDELAGVGRISSLEAAATRGRKHGLRLVGCVQSTAQLERLYGRESATVLRSCFRNFCCFALAKADPETAETFSQSLGEREVDRAMPSHSRSASGAAHSVSIQRVRERVVLPSELAELPDLAAFLCLAGAQPARRITLTPRLRRVVVPSIVE